MILCPVASSAIVWHVQKAAGDPGTDMFFHLKMVRSIYQAGQRVAHTNVAQSLAAEAEFVSQVKILRESGGLLDVLHQPGVVGRDQQPVDGQPCQLGNGRQVDARFEVEVDDFAIANHAVACGSRGRSQTVSRLRPV